MHLASTENGKNIDFISRAYFAITNCELGVDQEDKQVWRERITIFATLTKLLQLVEQFVVLRKLVRIPV